MDHSCRLPWTWLVINVEQNTWRFCCKSPWQVDFSNGYHPALNGYLVDVKDSFRRGDRPEACSVCWREEDAGGASYRTNVTGATTRDRLPSHDGIGFIDIIFGSVCNLRCASCGPMSSSQWRSLLAKNDNPYEFLAVKSGVPDKRAWDRIPELIRDNINSLSHINIYGGEPSIDQDFIEMMDRVCEADLSSRRNRPIEMRIYTNGVWPERDILSQRFLTNMNRARSVGWKVDVKFSIDAVGEHAHFVRHPTDWTLLDRNLDMMVREGLTERIHITSSLLNLPIQHEILEYMLDKPWRDQITPVANLVNRPPILSVANLGPRIEEFFTGWKDLPDLPTWRNYRIWIDNLINTQQNGMVDDAMLKRFEGYVDWYASVNNTTIPPKLAAAYSRYL